MKEQLMMMLIMQKANRRSKESTKALKEAEASFKTQIKELKKKNVQLKDIITKQVHAEYQAKNARPAEDEVEQNRREIMHDTTIHFDPVRSKMGEQVAHQVNLGKVAYDHLNRDISVDWKKEMMEELAKLMLEKNLITTYLTALVIRGVNKSPFMDWIMAEPKPDISLHQFSRCLMET